MNKTITPFDVSNYTQQYQEVNVGFRENQDLAQVKGVWIPMSVEVAPLMRVEYIKAVSLFFNNGAQAMDTYNKIIATYNTLRTDMLNIPKSNRRRIGWVKYDFGRGSWILDNTAFTRGIIIDAGRSDCFHTHGYCFYPYFLQEPASC